MRTTPIENTDLCVVDIKGYLGDALYRLPYSLRVSAENAIRHGEPETAASSILARDGGTVAFRPSRMILHDMLGLPLLVDIMAMRSKVHAEGSDASSVDMSLPVVMMCDHAMTINHWASADAFTKNEAREFEINEERFAFLKACEARFPNLRVIPPGGGIMHQINIEYLAKVALPDLSKTDLMAADTCLGTDSHTPMVNGVGVLGWGIGGLEAEAIMFGETTPLNVPRVIGLEVKGRLPERATATDIALTAAEKLRAIGVVDCYVEMFGPGYAGLSVQDRCTIANMAPEYGATSVFCPVDQNTLKYLRETGRRSEHVTQVERFAKAQSLWADGSSTKIEFDDVVTIDLNSLGRMVAGPSRPEQRVDLADVSTTIGSAKEREIPKRAPVAGTDFDVGDDDVIIAAITSCTNTANTRNIILAGLLARNAVAHGLTVKPHVKTSLAPGSRVVQKYLEKSGLAEPLDALGFQIAAFSCSTCNGMSGPLLPEIEDAITSNDIKGVAVLSGNRNFPGRIHPLSSRNVITAPPLVIAYALAGSILTDIASDPLGSSNDGTPVTLDDLWPDEDEVQALLNDCIIPDQFRENYDHIATVNPHWNALTVDQGDYDWKPSTYVTFPPFIDVIQSEKPASLRLEGLRPLAILGDSVTTDHISPSGTILPTSDAGKFLRSRGVTEDDFNSFGTRRGSADIIVRSTFANVQLANEMTPGEVGPWTRLEPDGDIVTIHEAIEAYRARGEQLIVIGGKDYGCGSSRDTAAKAPWLAGIRAVVAEGFERIHRSNLVNIGIAPLCFPEGVSRKTLKLDGSEIYDIDFDEDLRTARMTVYRSDGTAETVELDVRLYNDAERETFRHGGLLPRTFRSFITA